MDAVNGDQLNTTNTNVASNTTRQLQVRSRSWNALDAAAVQYDDASKDTITLAGTSGTTLTNLKAGSLAAGSTDAVNGDQLNTTNTNVAGLTTTLNGITSGGGIKYFHSNSTLADLRTATGADAVAIGGNAQSSSTGSVSLGAGSSAANGSVAIGKGLRRSAV